MICVAPARFSTTTGSPHTSARRAPIERESASVAPPGVVGTTIFTGRGELRVRAGHQQRDEQKSELLQRISSSARSSSGLGIGIPSAVAALTLMTRYILVGFSIGRSPGFAPLRILST